MNYCPKCDIVIRGNKRCCPLCQGKTAEVPETKEIQETSRIEAFPVIERRITSVTFIKIMTFLFLTLEICFGAVHILVVMYLRSNILKLLTAEAYVAIAVDIFVDHMTNMHGWSFAWVTPFILLGLGLITLLIAYVTKLRASEYVQYIALNTGAALLQFVPIHYGLNPVVIPAITITACYLILMAGVLVFQYNDLKASLGRRFNF